MLLHKLAKCAYALACICTLQTSVSRAQSIPAADTLRLTLKQAEGIFLDSNLQLLAQHYNIQSNKALVEQARKWDNPILATDQNLYSNHAFFQHGRDANGERQGQFFVQVQQLIKTAGKRGKQIDLAQTNVALAEWQFKTVMRELRATLIKDFYTIAQLQGNAALYTDNMERLLKLEKAMAASFAAGNIAQKEYLRVQALILNLKQDMTDNGRDLADAESELKTLLQISGNTFVLPVVEEREPATMPQIGIFQAMDTASLYNTDYNQQLLQAQYSHQNLRLQKALAVPDVTVGPEYDQSSNYIPNYYGLGINLPIPLWDRNQGNIKAARWQEKGDQALLKQAQQKLKNDVLAAWQKLQLTVNLNGTANPTFYNDYNQLYRNIVESYNNRQISLIEFLEYFNDYQDVRKNQLQQVLNLRMAKVELNDVVGIDIAQ